MHTLRIKQILVILSVFYLVGIAIHLFPDTRNLALILTEPQLLIINIFLLVYLSLQYSSKKFLGWLFIAFIFSVALEITGVKTGMIFGEYLYGDTMNLKLMGVPVVIGLNWIILILAGYSIAGSFSAGILRIILSGLIVVAFDFVMEPVAMHLDYWQWDNNTIPAQNYIAWFIITIILVSLLQWFKLNIDNLILKAYFIIQLLFFLTLRLFM